MKRQITLISLIFYLLLMFPLISSTQESISTRGWAIAASYSIPGKASGLAWDGTYIYFGIYGANGSSIYKFNPATGTNVLQCNGPFTNSYGMTYKSPNLVTVFQPSSSSQPSTTLEFTMAGATVSTIQLPDHYMSGVAYDNGDWWVCTYYPDPGIIYKVSATGAILSQFTAPNTQPWDICKQGNDLWIADYYGNMLYKVNTTGTVLESHASAGTNPSGVVFDGTYLWYCDGAYGAGSTLYKVDLTGAGTPVINVPVTTHDYGPVAIGESLTWNCQVQNTGNANLSITEIEIPAGQPISTTFNTPYTITPGNSATIPFTYSPVNSIPLDVNVKIHSNDPIHSQVNVNLTGDGVYQGPHLVLPTTGHDFGTRRAGANSKWYLPVSNDGSQSVIINNLTLNDEHFYIDESLTLPLIVGTLQTVEIPVWFHPTAEDQYSAMLSIFSNATSQGTLYYDFNGAGEVAYYPIGTPLWTYNINAGLDNSPKSILPFDDVTGDSIKDIIVSSEDYYIRCFNGNASVTGDVIWEYHINAGYVYQQNGVSVIDDINGDGFKDIIAGTTGGDKSIVAISGKTGLQLWKHQTQEYGTGGWVYQVDSKYDYNDDGFPDVLAAVGDDGNGTGPKRVYCLNGLNGVSIWQRMTGGAAFSVIGVTDFTGDSKPDVVAGATNEAETVGWVYGIDGATGLQRWSYSTTGSSVWGLMQLDDITSDGKADVAVGDFNGNIIFLNAATGAKVSQKNIGPYLILRLVDIGDINKNGYRDILVAHSGTSGLVIDGSTCTYIWTRPLSDKSWCVASIGDITWDGYNDAIIGTLYQDNNAYFLDGTDGQILNSYPAYAPVDALNGIPDITGDNSMEMLFGDREGLLTCLSGGFDSTTIAVKYIDPEVFNFVIYPNPNKGHFIVRVNTIEKIKADFTVLDMQGRIIYKSTGNYFDKGISSLEFDLIKNVKPGIYFLEAKTLKGSHQEKLIIGN
jgi:hypothetical protein